MRGDFGLPCLANEALALDAGRGAAGFFSQALGLIFKALIQRCRLLETAPLRRLILSNKAIGAYERLKIVNVVKFS